MIGKDEAVLWNCLRSDLDIEIQWSDLHVKELHGKLTAHSVVRRHSHVERTH